MKQTLTAVTPVGTFTRETATPYTHIVVWNSPRTADCARAAAPEHPLNKGKLTGVQARWVKDMGFGVTWHNSQRTAENAADAGYKWDGASTLVGVFPVGVETPAPAHNRTTLLRMVLDESEVLSPDGTARPLSAELLAMIRWNLG